ncbi:hypothetical protein SAMN05421780_101155 [Flexibacter flexilis DSM 6793]|uniref:Outer membrane protein beta-barrel domain-containing protein n=1 Tax=Flexibacter flexilis DSM 6793 TaxID=927664 RepID=A0A1I1DFM9_9BACT|nr:hypothetical protein [Flexibacter flexilis]SFB73172.1 hypothetical protein SAMN05421780_101155 [Flexibacter flexilis DSM 6793]
MKLNKTFIVLLTAIVFNSISVWAGNNHKTDSVQVVPRKYGVMVNLPHLLAEQLRLDVEIFSKKYRPNALFSTQSLIVAPRYYHNIYWETGGVHNKSTFGLGVELQHKLYLGNDNNELQDNLTQFYFGYGAGLNYLHTEGDFTTTDIFAEGVHINQKYLRYNSFATMGMNVSVKHFVIDSYIGFGYKYTHRLNNIQGQRPLDENILRPAYTGLYPVMGFKIGVLLFSENKR